MAESRLDGSLQRSQVTLNHKPDARAINSSYSCPKRFPTPRICGHGIPGHKFLRLWSEFARRFADSFQTALDSVVRLGVPNEGIDVHTRGESFYPDNVLQNVSEPPIGSLEGTDGLCLYASLHTRLQSPFLYQVDWLSEQAGQPQLDAYQIEERQPPRLIKAGQQVDIGIRATVAAPWT